MKSLVEFILESQLNEKAITAYDSPTYFFDGSAGEYYKKLGYKYYNDMNKPSKEDIANCYGTTSNVTGDPSFGDIDGLSFSKLKDNTWQTSSQLSHVLGGTINDKELLDRLNKAQKFYFMLRFVETSNKNNI